VTRAVFADVGPLYAAVDESDEHHRRATVDLQKLAKEHRLTIVAYPTLLEAHALVLTRLGTPAAQAWLELISDAAMINPDPKDYKQAIDTLKRLPDQKITLFDALLGILASRMGVQVWTYDHRFDVMRIPVWRSQ
jgi:predicted nucleic acid-binding protein